MLKPTDLLPPIISCHGGDAPGVVTPWNSTLKPARFFCVLTRLNSPLAGTAIPGIVQISFVSKSASALRENSKRSLYVSLGHNTGWHSKFSYCCSARPCVLREVILFPTESTATICCGPQCRVGAPFSCTRNRACVH